MVRPRILLALAAATGADAVDFDAEIRPLLEAHCLVCHQDANKLGELSLQTGESARRGGASGPSVAPGQPDASPLLARMELAPGSPGAMPPGGPQPAEADLAVVRAWILEGAEWSGPLRLAESPPAATSDSEELAVVREIHRRIQRRWEAEAAPTLEPYAEAVPGTDASLQMVPIPAGEFDMGTPEREAGRNDDEGPPRRVRVDAFWMGAHETSWDAYRSFMLREADGYQDPDKLVAAVSSPTPPYMEMSFGMGISGYPAISMTQHGASKYAQWLSAQTGRFYRLPTEAEWEYACRAGGNAPYSFGHDLGALADHAWYWGNSNAQYQRVGTRRPNAWGLFDMHGNVWEWTLDRYEPSYGDPATVWTNPWAKADALYPRVVRGGSWMDDAPSLRCGARRASEDSWKMQDPQLPKSIWYHTDAQWLGFRLVRPARLPSPEEMHAYWNSATGKD